MMDDIGKPVDRTDQKEKMAGSARYVADLKPDGLLYARVLRSSRPRARLLSVHLPPLPEGYYIVDRTDVPGINRVRLVINDQPFFAEDEVRYVGEPILMIVGPDKAEVIRLLKGTTADYEDIPAVLSFEDAENPALKPVHGDTPHYVEYHCGHGDAAVEFEKAAHVFEDVFETPFQEQMYLEPQGVIARFVDDRMVVEGSMQCPYYVKNALIDGLGWPADRIRVIQTTVGGGFGGKEDYPSLLAGQAAFAALKTGRPVQLVLDRAEDVEVTPKRHPSIIRLRTALDGQNRITALNADIRIDAGAYGGLSTVVLQRSMFNIGGVYRIPNIAVRGRAVATNRVPSGAFRGFGAPQAFFAIERHLDLIAHRLGEDPLSFKVRHLVRAGDPTVTGGTFRDPVPLPDLIESVLRQSDYARKSTNYSQMPMKSSGQSPSQPRRGIGLSLFLHGCGFTGSGERDHIKAQVGLHKHPDGTVDVLSAAVDMGQGARTGLRKIVATELSIPLDHVLFDLPDTDRVPDSGPTVASRTVMIVGRLLQEAASELKFLWQDGSEITVKRYYRHPEHMHWEDHGDHFSGDAYPAYSWGVNAVEVEVDPLTAEITVVGTWSAFDVGKAIDERIIRGQIEGGITQGLGYGSIEVVTCQDGRIRQRSMTDCIIPSSLDFGPIRSEVIDNPYDGGPFGAKGAGELPLVGAAPALAAAVSQATGLPISRIPVTSEYLMEAMAHG